MLPKYYNKKTLLLQKEKTLFFGASKMLSLSLKKGGKKEEDNIHFIFQINKPAKY